MMRLPLRVRVTLASAVSIALILGALSFFVYASLQAELVRAEDLPRVRRVLRRHQQRHCPVGDLGREREHLRAVSFSFRAGRNRPP